MNDNIEERINLQKALFEIEDSNIFNRSVSRYHGGGGGELRDEGELGHMLGVV